MLLVLVFFMFTIFLVLTIIFTKTLSIALYRKYAERKLKQDIKDEDYFIINPNYPN